MSNWQTIETAPNNKIVMTKIDDANGCRNEGTLSRSGRLWFVPDGSMYVYYQPTHWRELTDDERAKEEAKLRAVRDVLLARTERALTKL